MTTRMLELLPALYREDPFLGQFLQAFEKLLLGFDDSADHPQANPPGRPPALEQQIDRLARNFDAQNAPSEFLDWLASWVALSLRADLTDQQRRDFLGSIAQRYRRRGTRANLEELLKIFTRAQGQPHVVEDGPLYHFVATIVLPAHAASGLPLSGYPAFVDQQAAIATSIIEFEKPVHTTFKLMPVFPSMQIGIHSTVAVDTLLGSALQDLSA